MKTSLLKIIILVVQIILIVISLITLLPLAKAQTNRRIQISEAKKDGTLQRRYFTLLIAVSNFGNNSGIKTLDYPLQEAEHVQQVLTTRYPFEPTNITLLRNPNRSTIFGHWMNSVKNSPIKIIC